MLKRVYMLKMESVTLKQVEKMAKKGYEFTVMNDGYVLAVKGGF